MSNLAQQYFSKLFIAQVAPGQNQKVKGAVWKDAHGSRVRIRIPGKHPVDTELLDEDLPWAIVAKSTSHGNANGGSVGVWGGEWVIAAYMDESEQIPIILHVLGNNLSDFTLRKSVEGSTYFQRVDRYNSGLKPGQHQTVGGPKPTEQAQPTKEELLKAVKGRSRNRYQRNTLLQLTRG